MLTFPKNEKLRIGDVLARIGYTEIVPGAAWVGPDGELCVVDEVDLPEQEQETSHEKP